MGRGQSGGAEVIVDGRSSARVGERPLGSDEMTKREKTSGGRVLLRRYGVERIDGKWLVIASVYGNMTIIEARAEAKRRNKEEK